MLHLVLLDDAHLADLLFVRTLGRLAAGSARRLVFVHGGGGLVGRAFEARGLFPGDPLPDDLAGGGLARAHLAAHLAQTQALTRRLTDASVPAVGLQGSDRRLLVRAADGSVEAPGAAWLADLVGRGAVPVVSAVASGAGGGGDAAAVTAGEALVALASALTATGEEAEAVVLAAPGTPGPGAGDSDAAALAAASDRAAAQAVAAAGVALRVAAAPAFFAPGDPGGRRIGAG